MRDLDGRVVPTTNGFKRYDNGGEGSGNFGHSGRPGMVGGSGDGKGGPLASLGQGESYKATVSEIKKAIADSRGMLLSRAVEQDSAGSSSLFYDPYGYALTAMGSDLKQSQEILSMLPDEWTVSIKRTRDGFSLGYESQYKEGDKFTSKDGEEAEVIRRRDPYGLSSGSYLTGYVGNGRYVDLPDVTLFDMARKESGITMWKPDYEEIRKIAEGGKHNEKEAAEKIITHAKKWYKG